MQNAQIVNPYSYPPRPAEEVGTWLTAQPWPIRPGIPVLMFRDLVYYRLVEYGIPVEDTLKFDGEYATVLGPRHGGKPVLINGVWQYQCLWSNFCSGENPNPIHYFHLTGIYCIGDESRVIVHGKGEATSVGARLSYKLSQWMTYGTEVATAIGSIILTSRADAVEAEKIAKAEYFAWTNVKLS